MLHSATPFLGDVTLKIATLLQKSGKITWNDKAGLSNL
jgi:hypothetical protein